VSIYRLKGTSGALINQVFALSRTLVVGRADDCEIRIDHGSVAAHHAEIMLSEDGGVRIRELNTGNGISVNGEAVNDANLSAGDEIQIGNCRLLLQAPGLRPDRVLDTPSAGGAARRWPWLLVTLLAAAAVLAWRYGLFGPLRGLFAG
jgi:pSer/pThr/pTyr-binding forkhead associated (FHA) protein